MSSSGRSRVLGLLLMLTVVAVAGAQSGGALDEAFVPAIDLAGTVSAVVEEPGGTYLVAGEFHSVSLQRRVRVARLTAAGAVDPSFDPGDGPDGSVLAMARQSDGKVIIAGEFSLVDGVGRPHLARLDSDGQLDTTFGSGVGVDGVVRALALQGDGKVVIGGSFSSVNATGREQVARLHSNGAVDTTFDPGTGAGGDAVSDLLLQGDGKVVVAGSFKNFNGVARDNLARLEANGALDTTFDAGDIVGGIFTTALQTDGKLLIAGSLSSVAGTSRSRVARLGSTGSLDTTFDPGDGPDASVDAVALQGDGKVVLVGSFANVAGTARSRVARLGATGSLDTTFDAGAGPDSWATGVTVLSDGKVLVYGSFGGVGGTSQEGVARLTSGGAVDAAFRGQVGQAPRVERLLTRPDGSILVGGTFTSVDGQLRTNLARLHPDGTLDGSFVPPWCSRVTAIAAMDDGRVVVNASCRTGAGVERAGVSRLLSDGSLDETFAMGALEPALSSVSALALWPDGRLAVGGSFTTVGGVARVRVARLHRDGSVDTTFDPGTGADDTVKAVAVTSNGKLLIGGSFSNVGGLSRSRIARLNTTGYRDAGFDPGTGFAGGSVEDVHELVDGSVLAAGAFTSFNGTDVSGVARLQSSGALDPTFGSTSTPSCETAVPLADGKVLVGGSFENVQHWRTPGVGRLHATGVVDESFAVGEGAVGGYVWALAVQADLKVLVGGYFDVFAEQSRHSLARVRGSSHPVPWGFSLDRHLHAVGASNLNGILEPGETVIVEPTWRNADDDPMALASTVGPVSGTGATHFATVDATASYGTLLSDTQDDCYAATANCGVLQLAVPTSRPARHWDAVLTETPSPGAAKAWTVHVGASFGDVATSNGMYGFIETILHRGVTEGYADGTYRSSGLVTRAQMAMFIARARAGSDDDIPVSGFVPGRGAYLCISGGASLFTDVDAGASYCPHVHYLLFLGITTGCGGSSYCPSSKVKRDTMAMFMARAVAGDDALVPTAFANPALGRSYSCDPGSPVVPLTDVSAASSSCRHTHYLWARGIVDGCRTTPQLQYCPSSYTTRGAMAKFLTNSFDLTLAESNPQL